MLKRAFFFLLAFAMLAIYVQVVNAAPVSVKQLACAVEQTSAPPGVELQQFEQHQAEIEFQIMEAEQLTLTKESGLTIKGEILQRGTPPRVMEQIIKIEDEASPPYKSKNTQMIRDKNLLQRRHKLCDLYSRLSMSYRS